MKNLFSTRLITMLAISLALFSCSDKKEVLDVPPISDYMPLQVGKYITYRVDSLVFPDFGKEEATHHYQVKHEINAEFTDNKGNKVFRVFRYINNQEGSGEWKSQGSYTITEKQNSIEVTEDNLRFIRLYAPVRENNTWAGNTYLPDNPYEPLGFNLSEALTTFWQYYYLPIETSFSYADKTYDDVLTVEENDEDSNLPVVYGQPGSAYKSRSFAKYAKGIGLVFRHTELWEYQQGSADNPDPFFTGFGITMWMIDHN